MPLPFSILNFYHGIAPYSNTAAIAPMIGVFCTGPSIANTGLNIFSEAVGTYILVFAIKGIGNVTGLSTGVDKLFVFGIIVSVGMSLGGLTGYAINPARDFGPSFVPGSSVASNCPLKSK